MPEILSQSTPIARKDYRCQASYFINEGDYTGYTFKEYRQMVKARRNGWKIIKGQKYVKQNNKDYGEIYTFRAIPEMHDICLKYDLYQE